MTHLLDTLKIIVGTTIGSTLGLLIVLTLVTTYIASVCERAGFLEEEGAGATTTDTSAVVDEMQAAVDDTRDVLAEYDATAEAVWDAYEQSLTPEPTAGPVAILDTEGQLERAEAVAWCAYAEVMDFIEDYPDHVQPCRTALTELVADLP